MDASWFVKSFQEDYSTLYQHRDEESARKEIDGLLQKLPLPKTGRVLDFCCGDGRHTRALARHGYEVVGFDLSEYLLDQAHQKTKDENITYYRYDMREIPFESEFDILFNLFTSFGYFPEDAENEKVLHRMAQALRPDGHFVIDYLNPLYIEEHLVPESSREVEDKSIVERRKIEDGFVVKEINITEKGKTRRFWEKVRLYSLEEMKTMLSHAGMEVESVYGDYDFSPYSKEGKRMIIYGHCRK
ncbi:SAM-dependent methyltransferase [Aneurinibacillus migulanus]|uniref:Methyltransferase domain-containing protein n=1 Tax=Aneurinibacillus migulanus TaxID=47500 RepID=A0A0D1XUZ6_ANEMI|nr:class I SAM-dependent methyltransferase [Aneurinibacillus migulanus]KIV54881.1 SAM-dependent methyltransferase [Aneurinibacillus migulanus]KIV57996.1 SAM-dependent methyltransferase [Aneurinibacillus migulanus]KON95483.1 SAM-dependent methyltransferase [Aneurinibacillus migulanus]KPD06215.1 SAM-dependent methyltransferase [Aneurinibacillus migulanus]MCP1355940.1 class I SAM-dependent methyltransferase [Aneurinibacillus migulanus]